ncbi:hypothetical protein [Flavobacterium olei]|uniref:hypothetical protein n=1 Tax=Flavobacterium olei TaxID=1886782 RepID=UPI00321A3869
MIFVFKTNVFDDLAAMELKPLLDMQLPNSIWNFDLEDCDKILRIDSQIEIAEKTINLLQNIGYHCEELT